MLICGLLSSAAFPGGTVETEIPPAAELPCFPGAYYRKAVSSPDLWTGIEGEFLLPEVSFDQARKRSNGKFADNPSVYMGGTAGDQEVDAGLSWEVIKEPDGTISPVGKAYRPFWRDSVRKSWNSGPARPEYYFYPGDRLRMSCNTTETGKLILQIELLSRRDKRNTTSSAPLIVAFDAKNFGPGRIQQFKRVNAVDQASNEGNPAQPSATSVTGAVWYSVMLHRGGARIPMTADRFTDMRCPDPKYFRVVQEGLSGGERITISGEGVEQ